jgi:hypothetical protein
MTSKTKKTSTPANTKPLEQLFRRCTLCLKSLKQINDSTLRPFAPPIQDDLINALGLFWMRLDGMLHHQINPVPTDEQLAQFTEFCDIHPRLHFDDDLIA